jgi:vacuolar-type H+-ATPase subunit F/Vma7
MSRLVILTRPALVPGFQLAGVDVYGVEDVEGAQDLIEQWIEFGEVGLLAIDDGLLELLNPSLIHRLNTSGQFPYLAIPGGQPFGPESSRKYRIAEMIRRAIGFHITFKGEDLEE